MAAFPHLFVWDDHEIHDGWGSEARDLHPSNVEMFQIARSVAEEYVLNAGPRVRPKGTDAHQSYVLGPMAAFVFDTRSSRNYVAPRDRLISRQQFEDFIAFLDTVGGMPQLRDVVLLTTVPFVGIREWVTDMITEAPDAINDPILQGVRDDLRDSWTSPGNIETLTAVLSALKSFMNTRPDVGVTNVSGDIHVGNAFAINVNGAANPIMQVTSSAITNRHHAPDILSELIEVGEEAYIDGVGDVRRIWPTVTAPNFLQVRTGPDRSEFTLKVWNPSSPMSNDLTLVR